MLWPNFWILLFQLCAAPRGLFNISTTVLQFILRLFLGFVSMYILYSSWILCSFSACHFCNFIIEFAHSLALKFSECHGVVIFFPFIFVTLCVIFDKKVAWIFSCFYSLFFSNLLFRRIYFLLVSFVQVVDAYISLLFSWSFILCFLSLWDFSWNSLFLGFPGFFFWMFPGFCGMFSWIFLDSI